MNAIVGVIVDNCVFITTIFVLLLVSVFAVILWRRKLQTNGGDTVVGEEFFVEDSQPRSKKSVKLKPKKTKPEKAKLAVANGHVPNMQDATVLKPSQDVSKPLSVTPAEKPQKSQAFKLKTATSTRKPTKMSPKADESEYKDGAWTEVPSRKKLRAKKDAPELQENRTRNETVDTIQQDSHTRLESSESSSGAPPTGSVPPPSTGDANTSETLNGDDAVVTSSLRDDQMKTSTTAAADDVKTDKKKARKQKTAGGQRSVNSASNSVEVDDDKLMCQQTNQPAEKNVTKAGSVTMFPVSSTAVPEPSVMQQNMSPVPESIEPTRNKSIPAATAQSAVAFDELGDELAAVAVNKRKKKVRRDN